MGKNNKKQKGSKFHCPRASLRWRVHESGYSDHFVSEEEEEEESVSTHANSSIPEVGSQNPANPNVKSPSPESQSNVRASTKSSGTVTRFLSAIFPGIATHVTKFGSGANFAGATAIAFGPQSTATYNSHNSYNIRLSDQELTGTQVHHVHESKVDVELQPYLGRGVYDGISRFAGQDGEASLASIENKSTPRNGRIQRL
ncbi:hypothetical protein JOM56_009914 [Amanita muscaria]